MQYTGSIIENVFCNAQKLRNKRLDWSRLKQPREYRILNRCKVLNTAVGYEYNQRMKDKKNFPQKSLLLSKVSKQRQRVFLRMNCMENNRE